MIDALDLAIEAGELLVLLDELLSSLDALLRVEPGALPRKVGFAGVYVTLGQSEAFVLATRITAVDRGRIE